MENENNVNNTFQTTPVDQAVVNGPAPVQTQATNVVENNVVKEDREESNNNRKRQLL